MDSTNAVTLRVIRSLDNASDLLTTLENRVLHENEKRGEAEAKAERFAHALVTVLDGVQDHELQIMTGLCEADCDEIARTRSEAATLVRVRL
jgi:hypothetical protein